MGWTIELDYGGDLVTLDANMRFQLGYQNKPNDQGQIESVLYGLSIDGEVKESTPSAISARFKELSELVVGRVNPIEIRILLDGVVEHHWQPNEGFTGPFVTNFNSVERPGNGYSIWAFHMEAAFRSKNFGSAQEEVYDLVKTLSVAKDNNRVIRKVWTVSAKSTSALNAKAFVLGFKPSGSEYQEEIKLDYPNARASAVWIWEALQEVFCNVSFEGGGRDYIQDPQVGVDRPPQLFLAQREATVIKIRGYVRGFTEALIRPAKHFAESATMKEVTAGQRFKVEVESAEKGIYRLQFSETWLCTSSADPDPNHEKGHHLITLKGSSEPADGAIGS